MSDSNPQALPIRDDAPAERERLLVVLGTFAVSLVGLTALKFYRGPGWHTGFALNALNLLIFILYAVLRRDRLMARLVVFGLIVGFIELVADAWIVNYAGILDYSVGGGRMLWKSPFWMPIAWAVLAVQFGYIGMRLHARWRLGGLILVALIAVAAVPFYQEMAQRAKWWKLHDAAMAPHTNTPWAVILSEVLVIVLLAYFAGSVRRGLGRTVLGAVVAGVLIVGVYIVSFWALGGLPYPPST